MSISDTVETMSEAIFPVLLKTRFPLFRTILSVLFGLREQHSNVVESKKVAEESKNVQSKKVNFCLFS